MTHSTYGIDTCCSCVADPTLTERCRIHMCDMAQSNTYMYVCVFYMHLCVFYTSICVCFFFPIWPWHQKKFDVLYIYADVYIHTYIHTCMPTSMYTCTRMYTKTHTYTHTHTHTHAHAHAFSLYRLHSYTHTRTHTHTHTPSRMNRAIFRNNIYIYICIHTG